MFKEILNIEDITNTLNLEDQNVETTNNTSFHPIVGFYNYDDIENDEVYQEILDDDTSYTFPVLIIPEKEDV